MKRATTAATSGQDLAQNPFTVHFASFDVWSFGQTFEFCILVNYVAQNYFARFYGLRGYYSNKPFWKMRFVVYHLSLK